MPVFEMSVGTRGDGTSVPQFSFTRRIVCHVGKHNNSWVDVAGFDLHELLFKKFDGPPNQRPSYENIVCGKWLAVEGAAMMNFCPLS